MRFRGDVAEKCVEEAESRLIAQNDSLGELYGSFRGELHRYVIKQFKCSDSDAEDIVQQTFIKLSAVSLEKIEVPRVYLYKVAHNIAVDTYRKRSKIDARTDELSEDPIDTRGPERVIEGKKTLEILAKAIDAMPEKRREYFLMHRFEQLSFAEISRRVGLSESMIRKHVSNALADCHRCLSTRNMGEN